MKKIRLDLLLQERGLAESRSKAQAVIMAGQVRVAGQVIIKPATSVASNAEISIVSGPKYVSRGGEKLEGALQDFPVNVSGRICADVGASTGGFTDCLLQNGAQKVYAIDVGKGILHWKLRQDTRVTVMEETNARYIEQLPETVDLIVCDASFISLKILLPVFKGWSAPTVDLITLIKPQFEAGKKQSAKGKGVIRDPLIHRQVLADVLEFARSAGYVIRGLSRSPIQGPKGNIEFLAWLQIGDAHQNPDELIESVIQERFENELPEM